MIRIKNFHPLNLVEKSIALIGLSFVVFLVASISTPANAQDLQVLLDKIERLERDIRTLNIQVARGNSSTPTLDSEGLAGAVGGVEVGAAAIARFDTRMTSLENDARLATGTMEEVDHRIRTIEGKVEKLIMDIDFRLSELEKAQEALLAQGEVKNFQATEMSQQLATAPSVIPVNPDLGQTSSGVLGTITGSELEQISLTHKEGVGTPQSGIDSDTNADSIQGTTGVQNAISESTELDAGLGEDAGIVFTPKEQYTKAFGLLRQAKYDDAAIALQDFINQYPDEELALNARYWLGETYYVRSEFVRAAEIFFEGYKLAPTGPKAPDTLLKLGMALGTLDKKVEACAAFTKLIDEFPNVSPNIKTTLERERLRNAC